MKTLISQKRIDKGMYWDRAWSLVEGCTPVSPGCDNCWSAAQCHMRSFQLNNIISRRYEGLTTKAGKWNGKIRLLEHNLNKPSEIKKPKIFNIWNDLFHNSVPESYIVGAIEQIMKNPQHIYLILTKRIGRAHELITRAIPNVALGVTVENSDYLWRISKLLEIPAAMRWVSLEPMLGEIDLGISIPPSIRETWGASEYDYPEREYLDWVVVGAETGKGHRPCKLEWIESIVQQCKNASVPCFVKKIEINGRITGDMNEWPEHLRVRQFPEWMKR